MDYFRKIINQKEVAILEKEAMDEIKKLIIAKLNEKFGYCGVTESDDFVMINSGKEKDLIIKMDLK